MIGQSYALHAGEPRQALGEAGEQSGGPVGCESVACRIETRGEVGGVAQPAAPESHHQDEHHGGSHLVNHKKIAQTEAPVAAAPGSHARLQGGGQIRPRGRQRGQKPESGARQGGGQKSEERDPQIRSKVDFRLKQSGVAADPGQQVEEAISGSEARHSAARGQDQTFGQQLADHPEAAGADGKANGDLPGTGASPSQDQPGQVGAGQ